ncbi:hypothetical protein BCR33DRAFT_338409 [Rhizoclosmatium globosum]|uniref:C2H2-type domain-containing protein n=1 Tax=Rhizoclosmatium globosum TaxID=329046 RepID=A0A1Y2C3Y7_9FUNG|nr:hypothetical protein BCR33DRAFT_338409 [Rhizoclosmatium globosum]|eukprot:ORY41721.1 hypothetical protein BCR33DRAFT_338409 [Rhizoclosmatium globosum]
MTTAATSSSYWPYRSFSDLQQDIRYVNQHAETRVVESSSSNPITVQPMDRPSIITGLPNNTGIRILPLSAFDQHPIQHPFVVGLPTLPYQLPNLMDTTRADLARLVHEAVSDHFQHLNRLRLAQTLAAVHSNNTISPNLTLSHVHQQDNETLLPSNTPLPSFAPNSPSSDSADTVSNLERQPAPTHQINHRPHKPTAPIKPLRRTKRSPNTQLSPKKLSALHHHIRALKSHRSQPSIKNSFKQCPTCNTRFSSSVLLSTHLRERHGLTQCPYGSVDGEMCSMELNGNWREHCIGCHSGAPRPVCPECGRRFCSVTSKFKLHLRQCRLLRDDEKGGKREKRK